MVGCDVALLDQRFLGGGQYSGRDSDYVVFSFPGYSPHWALTRPWLTEEWYASTIRDLAAQISQTQRIVFVEFDQVIGRVSDSDYWAGLPCTLARPATIEDAAALFRNASHVYAGRLHAAILGSVLGVPTLAFAYHHKFEVVSELGIPTVGLTGPCATLPKPERPDMTILESVRQRGLDVLSSVRTDG
ncbi:polysaccharide pyruvyl transferase family protein [Paenarthrobacter nitroguajacolicus]|uniref:polysaccharide pyruvyl transferase family protein n=1 Tax=Paenarthrobacter nitroguajacolicus TaxID=211146 RepID=UPI003ADD2754